jgi:hypothetical protein
VIERDPIAMTLVKAIAEVVVDHLKREEDKALIRLLKE